MNHNLWLVPSCTSVKNGFKLDRSTGLVQRTPPRHFFCSNSLPDCLNLRELYLVNDLGRGESECLAIASRPAYELLTDNLDAR